MYFDSAVWCTPRSLTAVWYTPRRFLKIWISLRNRKKIRKWFSLFVRGPDGFKSWKNRAQKSRDTHPLCWSLLKLNACMFEDCECCRIYCTMYMYTIVGEKLKKFHGGVFSKNIVSSLILIKHMYMKKISQKVKSCWNCLVLFVGFYLYQYIL